MSSSEVVPQGLKYLFDMDRQEFLVDVDLDPVPGTFHTPYSAYLNIQGILESNLSHYEPISILVSERQRDGRKGVYFLVRVYPFNSKESARRVISQILSDRIPHYNPIVSSL